ncbi:unnamed protein product [Penicillium glandicola]
MLPRNLDMTVLDKVFPLSTLWAAWIRYWWPSLWPREDHPADAQANLELHARETNRRMDLNDGRHASLEERNVLLSQEIQSLRSTVRSLEDRLAELQPWRDQQAAPLTAADIRRVVEETLRASSTPVPSSSKTVAGAGDEELAEGNGAG